MLFARAEEVHDSAYDSIEMGNDINEFLCRVVVRGVSLLVIGKRERLK